MAEIDGSEDVNDFLLRIRELGDQRDREDEERTRKLEEEILQGRKERQARRAERARSISPTKEPSSSAGTPASIRSTADSGINGDVVKAPFTFSPPDHLEDEMITDKSKDLSEGPSKENRPYPPRNLPQPPSKPLTLANTSPSAAMLSRSGTLSWQQRPTSRGSTGPRARPLSQIAAENNTSRSTRASVEPPAADEPEISMTREQVGELLGSKDPAWFTQTHERGHGSAAYRRNEVDPTADTASTRGNTRLPGMSREPTVESERQSSPVSGRIRSVSPSRTDSVRGGSVRQLQYTKSISASSSNGNRAPLPNFASPSFEPPTSDVSSHGRDSGLPRGMAMSPSQGRISPERLDRPASPTKGLGGFVQSAMLKRSDSVNKRWSAQPGTGLSRGNSIASNRSGYEASRYGIPDLPAPKDPMPPTLNREASPLVSSRPSSSHGIAESVHPAEEKDTPLTLGLFETRSQTLALNVEPVKLVRSHEVLPSNLPELDEAKPDPPSRSSPPSSPSKRWSPTKSSWLENAINKPDSPKPTMPPPSQPSWMTNISQAKQQRGSVDLGKGNTFKDVSTSGLLRSPPMGATDKTTNISGLPYRFRAGMSPNPTTNSDVPVSRSHDGQAGKVQPHIDEEAVSELQPRTPVAMRTTAPNSTKPEKSTSISPQPVQITSTAGSGETSASSPRSSKAKPEMPPKKDFRSNLKSRQLSGEKKTTEDPEFKNVFGKLKRTQTQNYVAPDEFKGNILRGKAGLAATGGPKKTERRDEFKESLVKQKQAIKAGPPSVGRKPDIDDTSNDQKPSTPEALLKRQGLSKSESNSSITKVDITKLTQQPEALARFKTLKGKPHQTTSDLPPQNPVASERTAWGKGRLGSDFNSSLAGVLARGPSPSAGGERSTKKAAVENDLAITGASGQSASPEAGEGRQLTHMTKSRARGPKRRLPTATKGIADGESYGDSETITTIPTLTPAKSRSVSKPDIQNTSNVVSNSQSRPLASISNNHRKPSQPQPLRKPSPHINKAEVSSPLPPTPKSASTRPTSPRPQSHPSIKPKPLSPEFQRARQPSASIPDSLSIIPQLPREQVPQEQRVVNPSRTTPVQSVPQETLPQEEGPLPSVRDAAASWDNSGRQERSSQGRVRSPIKLPTRKDEQAAMKDAGLTLSEEAPMGLGIHSMEQGPGRTATAIHNLPTPPPASPKSPPIPAKKPPLIAHRVVSNPAIAESSQKSNGSLIPPTSEAARLFAELFDESSAITNLKVNIDTPAVLALRVSLPATDKIRTLRKQIWEVTPGGKLIPVAPERSHILFEDSLYICHHVFGSLTGTRTTEVYFWCGDGVAASAVEDAHIFARKEAKDHGGKLIVLQQGKETSNFFQALGGIVITRHGQSDRAPSRYMLCGRRHVGQIAFDEVGFSPQNLCRGFPYIISSGSGKIHLWKGIGSGIDELGCARLIGMDLGVHGEIEEVEGSKEPDAFWRLFPDSAQQRQPSGPTSSASKHWHLKPSIDQYATRLYQVDIEAPRPKSSASFWSRRGSAPTSTPTDENGPKWNAAIKEILPFAQSDVFHDGVFVLDTFFEVFVILPSFPSTSLLLPSFRTACLFAQEYAIIAASSASENRPFVPQGFVLLLGVGRDAVPEGVKYAFRKWDAGKVRGCRVLGLVESLEALTAEGGGVGDVSAKG
ncbi:MAG: hypothetical protein LQ341_002835 [Variospora aurantia]|nr:MAG: hypothetical protein LQ341_002835 [Variospora aurantia]